MNKIFIFFACCILILPGFSQTVQGQAKVPVFAERENFFFLKVVDAQLEFIKGADGKIEKLILYQNGQQMPARKIK